MLRYLIFFPSKLRKEVKTAKLSGVQVTDWDFIQSRHHGEVDSSLNAVGTVCKEKAHLSWINLSFLQNQPRLPSCPNPWEVSHI